MKDPGWKFYTVSKDILYPHSTGYWQKKVDGVYVQVACYPAIQGLKESFTMDFDTEVGGGVVIRSKIFSFHKLDFKLFEKLARKYIRRLK